MIRALAISFTIVYIAAGIAALISQARENWRTRRGHVHRTKPRTVAVEDRAPTEAERVGYAPVDQARSSSTPERREHVQPTTSLSTTADRAPLNRRGSR